MQVCCVALRYAAHRCGPLGPFLRSAQWRSLHLTSCLPACRCPTRSRLLTRVIIASQIARLLTVDTVSGACGGPYCCAQHVHVQLCTVGQCVLCFGSNFHQQGGGARHGVYGGQIRSPSDCGAGTSVPSARSGVRVEIPAIKVCRHVLARSRDGCIWSCSRSTASAPCQRMSSEVILLDVFRQV